MTGKGVYTCRRLFFQRFLLFYQSLIQYLDKLLYQSEKSAA